MRPIPEFKTEFKVPDKAPARSGYITQVREYELITPLFGGGVEPGLADPVTVIRATEIRGHLRFWWRATRGGQFDGGLQKMKEAEDAIFGAASSGDSSQESSVSIQVVIRNSGQQFSKDKKGFDIFDPQGDYGYAAFALRPTAEQGIKKSEFRKGVQFELRISYPRKLEFKKEKQAFQINSQKEIEAALWAWETFGGIGARTRRGFGAIKLLSIAGQKFVYPHREADIQKAIGDKLNDYQALEDFPDDVPHVHDFQLYGAAKPPEQTHLDLINLLKGFRQDRGGSKFGRSRWPEADEIRRLTKSGSPTKNHVSAFPRAYLGLPIMFEFATEKGKVPKATLQSQQGTRLASPLLLRPYPLGTDAAIGLIVELDGTLGIIDDGLEILERKNKHSVKADVPDRLIRSVPPLRGKSLTIDAFFEYIKELNSKKGRTK